MYETGYSTGPNIWFWAIWLAAYLYWGYTQYRIAQKVGHNSPWQAWVPIVNLYQQVTMARKEWWWFVLMLIPVVNIVTFAIVWINIARACSKSEVWGIFMLIPFLNIISMGYLAFSDTTPPPTPQYESQPAPKQPENVI